MSEGKWLIFDGIIIDKLESIIKEIDDRIKRNKDWEEKYPKYMSGELEHPVSKEGLELINESFQQKDSWETYPLEELLEELRFLKIKHQLNYLGTDISFFEDHPKNRPNQKEHWEKIFSDEYPKDIEWIQKRIQNDRNLLFKEKGFDNLIVQV